jgi:hypothetical protein
MFPNISREDIPGTAVPRFPLAKLPLVVDFDDTPAARDGLLESALIPILQRSRCALVADPVANSILRRAQGKCGTRVR